ACPRQRKPSGPSILPEGYGDEEIEGDEAVLGPNLDCRKVDGRQYLPVSLEKGLPGGLAPPLGRRLDAMLFQDVGHAGIGDLMAQIGQGTLNAVITPGGVLLGEAHHQIPNFPGERQASWFLLPTVAVVPPTLQSWPRMK